MKQRHIDTLVAIYDSLSTSHMASVRKHEFRSAEEYRKAIDTLAAVLVYCSQKG